MNHYFLYRKAWRFEDAPHTETRLNESDWKALLQSGGLFVRNTYDFDRIEESSFWFVIKNEPS